MRTRGVWVLAATAALAIAGLSGCGGPSKYSAVTTTTRAKPAPTIPAEAIAIEPNPTAQPATNALGCTSMSKAKAAPEPGPGSTWLAQSIDCFRDNRFIGRVDSFRHLATGGQFLVAMTARYGTRTPSDPKAASSPCGTDSPGVVAGSYWVIVTPGEDLADGVAKQAGGRVIKPLNGSGPIKGYAPLVCTR